MKKEFTFIWGKRICLIVYYMCVLGGGGLGGYNCQVAAAVIILNDIT